MALTVPYPLEDVSSWASMLRSNTFMEQLMETSKMGNQVCQACESVEENAVAVIWCKKCREALCEKCKDAHKKMKLSFFHELAPLDGVILSFKGIDIDAIKDSCNRHKEKPIEIVCYDHNELCCISCMMADHRRCDKVFSINNDGSEDAILKQLPGNIRMLNDFLKHLLKVKEDEKSNLKESVQIAEKAAFVAADKMKDEIDEIITADIKEINIRKEERNTQINVSIRLIEQFIQHLQHWNEVSKIVGENGSAIQTFLHLETVKHQIGKRIREILENFQKDTSIQIKFEGIGFEQTNRFGFHGFGSIKPSQHSQLKPHLRARRFNITEEKNPVKLLNAMIVETAKLFKINDGFPFLEVQFEKYFRYEGCRLKCGASVGKHSIALVLVNASNAEQLCFVNKTNFRISDSKELLMTGCNRLCFAAIGDRNFLILSYNFHNEKDHIFRIEVTGERIREVQHLPHLTKSNYLGAMVERNGVIYIVADSCIKQFPASQHPYDKTGMIKCFSAETHKKIGRTGIGYFDESLIYATGNDYSRHAIECTDLQGSRKFSYSSDIGTIEAGIAVLPSGAVLVMNTSGHGALHVVSPDGTSHITLLDKFQNIDSPVDMWLDPTDNSTLYIIVGEYIEVYKILGDKTNIT